MALFTQVSHPLCSIDWSVIRVHTGTFEKKLKDFSRTSKSLFYSFPGLELMSNTKC